MDTPVLQTSKPSPSGSPQRTRLLLEKFLEIRQTSLHLARPLSAEDCQVQSMPDASPVKWHLAHTTWFFETFILSVMQHDYRAFSAEFKILFNSYYNAVGDKHPRAARGVLSRPPLTDVLAYRRHVDQAMARLAESDIADRAAFEALLELGLNHEQQHQELILTDVKHMLSCSPLKPAYTSVSPPSGGTRVMSLAWTTFQGGVVRIGNGGTGFTFDNESPEHEVLLQPYALANRPVTQGEYLAFMRDGGYTRPELWLSAGWDAVSNAGWTAPMYWSSENGEWQQFTLHGLAPVALSAPVTHISYFEADAYARWAGARLPREAEWEHAARTVAAPDDPAYNFLEGGRLRPITPAQTAGEGLVQMFGDVWEWTSSSYDAYPGFKIAEGAVGEYNGKFMCNQYVLRGGSCVTPRSHIRASYRNFFPTDARWQFSGIRLARYL